MTAAALALAPDAVLPHRDALVDGAAVAERLTELLGVPVEGWRLRRAKYRVGESLRATYDITAAGNDWVVTSRMFPAGRSAAAMDAAVRRTVPVDPLPPVVHDAATGTVFWVVPNDRRLTTLPQLLEPAGTAGADRADLVELAAEKSATARWSAGGEVVAYAKTFADDTADVVARRYARLAPLAARAGVRVPEVAAHDAARRIVALTAVPGRAAADLDAADLGPVMAELGRVLAAVHAMPQAAPGRFARLEAPRLATSAAVVGAALPDLADEAARLRDRLAATRPADPGPDVALHGDVHLRNLLVDGDGIGLIDFDQGGAGPAACDVASMVARLAYGRITGAIPADLEPRLRDGFLAAYRNAGGRVPDLTWFVAACLLAERALRPVTRLYPAGIPNVAAVLAEAHRVLDEGAGA